MVIYNVLCAWYILRVCEREPAVAFVLGPSEGNDVCRYSLGTLAFLFHRTYKDTLSRFFFAFNIQKGLMREQCSRHKFYVLRFFFLKETK